MNMSEQVSEIFAAITKAQATYGTVAKTKKGHVGNFADLADCILAVKIPFAENKLSYAQCVVDMNVQTLIMHSSGQWLMGTTPINLDPIRKPLNSSQMFGIGEAYAKRYGFCSMVGLVADDNDADYIKGQETITRAGNGGELPLIDAAAIQQQEKYKDVTPAQYQWIANQFKVDSFDLIPLNPANVKLLNSLLAKVLAGIENKKAEAKQ